MRLSVTLLTAMSFGSLTGTSHGQTESKMTFVLENCYKAEISAIAGIDTSACLIFDARELSGTFEFKFCGGFYFDEKLKVFGVGGGAGVEKKACLKYEAKIKAKSEKEAVKKLEDTGPLGRAVRERLLGEIKQELKRLPDETLMKIGIKREQIDQARSLELKNIRDESRKTDEIRKSLEKCPTVSSKAIS